MTSRLKLSVSAAALALLFAGGISSSRAADVVPEEPGCMFGGQVMAGYMYNWQDSPSDLSFTGTAIENKDFDFGGDVDWQTPFAEGAVLVTCSGLNIQGDFAYYDHTADIDGKDDIENTNMHGGGALFYRDPDSLAVGLSASAISQDIEDIDGKENDLYRVGVFGEFYFDDAFTLGGAAHYYNSNREFADKDVNEDGFELAAWGRFYPTENFGLMLRGDVLLPSTDLDFNDEIDNKDFELDDAFAVTGEAEYKVWDQGLTVFGGARYAERSWNFRASDLPFAALDLDNDVDDFQVYAGLKFYFDFGREKTLVQDHRTGAFDNTSVFHEKLPEIFSSSAAGLLNNDVPSIPPP